jgi:O-antigen/teichoic acid export membrane protein
MAEISPHLSYERFRGPQTFDRGVSTPPKDATQGPPADDGMSAAEIKSRASSGAVLLMGRGVAFQGLGFLGNLVLARLLVPEDFGIVAVGLTVVTVGQVIAGAGLGAALVSRNQAPTTAELRAVTGLQLLLTSAVAAVAGGIAIGIGEGALVTALMVLALPLTAFRTPAMLLFQRRLEFGAQVKVEIAETLVYLAVSIVLAVFGLGAWSLAIATVVRVLTGAVVAIVLSPLGFQVPSLRFSLLRSIFSFGWRFQATGISRLATDTALTAGIGAIGGLGALGLWTFASKILGIPRLLFESMWRVGFPAFSRLMNRDDEHDMRDLLERTVGTFAAAVSLIICPLVASSPALVPLLFGAAWTDVSLIMPGAGLAMIIAGPLGIVTSSYLYAKGDASTGLVGSNITGVTRLAVSLALLPSLGVIALGIGGAAGTLSGMAYTLPRARRASGARLGSRVAGPAASATLGGLGGWLVAEALGVTVVGALLAALSALGIWLLVMVLLARGPLKDGVAMGRNIFGSAFGRARVVLRKAPAATPAR